MIHTGDAVAAQAQSDVTIAYDALAGQACDFNLTGQDLGGLTLTPGVYCFDTSAQLTGQLTLDVQGDPNAVFVFQMGSTLTTASSSSVVFSNGGPSCDVFWQVGSSATFGTADAFAGNVIALQSATLTTGASVIGKVLARNGAVTLDTNTILPCVAAPAATATPTWTATATRTPTVTPTPTALTHSYAHGYAYGHAYSDVRLHTHPYAHGHAHADRNCYSHAHGYAYSDRDCHPHAYGHVHGDRPRPQPTRRADGGGIALLHRKPE